MTVHGSKGLRRTLLLIAALGGVFFAATLSSPGGDTGVGSFALGLGVAALAAAFVLRVPEESCSFCRKPRAQVQHLVAGPGVSICNECVPLSLAVLLETPPPRWELVLTSLPAQTPHELSAAVVKAAAAGCDHARLGGLVAECLRLQNPDAARALLEAIPEAARKPDDWINLGVALGRLGRYPEAIAATQHASDSEPWVLNNVAAFRLDAEPDLREGLQPMLDDVARARSLGDKLPEPMRATLRVATSGTLAELHRRLGAFEKALACLAEAEAAAPGDPWRLLTKAKVLQGMGDVAGARALFEQLATKGHPEALVTRDAQRCLAGLG